MGEVCFYLKKAETGKERLIYLQYRYHGNKLVFAFGQSVNLKNWNIKKQRVKSNNETTADGQHSLNDLLDKLKEACEKAYHTEIKNGVPAPATLKRYLVNFFKRNEEDAEDKATLMSLIQRFLSGEIKHRGNDKAKNTLKQYKSTYNHLLAFGSQKGNKVNFDNITLDFYYRFTDYLKHRGLNPNSIGKNIKNVKVFMNEAVDMGYTSNMQFKHKKFTVPKEETDAVYLSQKEIMQLYSFNLENNMRLEQVRDLFVFGCCTGLRFSDYSDVKADNLVKIDDETFIKIVTKKTRREVIIPSNTIIQSIFEKYDANANKLPKAISNQKLNDLSKKWLQ